MTNSHLFFQLEEEEDAADAYDRYLLEDKKYFLQKPVLRTLYVSRWKRMDLWENAAMELHTISRPESDFNWPEEEAFASDWREALSDSLRWKKQLLTHLFATQSVAELKRISLILLERQEAFLQYLFENQHIDLVDTRLSVMTDEMSLVSELNALFKKTVGSLESWMAEVQPEFPALQSELNRLFLQYQKMKNDG